MVEPLPWNGWSLWAGISGVFGQNTHAISILETYQIRGEMDVERNANFSVGSPRPDIADKAEICLEFEWPNSHAFFVGWPFGKGELQVEGTEDKCLFHIYTDHERPWEDMDFSRNYHQSILYPNSKGLIFKGFFYPSTTDKKRTENRTLLKRILELIGIGLIKKSLDEQIKELAESRIGKPFHVP